MNDVSIIVAYNNKRVIGKDGKLPWNNSEDMRHFSATTNGHAVIMGRKTWESIGSNPLPNRNNYVVTSRAKTVLNGHLCEQYVPTLEEAIKLASHFAKFVFIIGGQQIYQYALDNKLVDRIIATELDNDIDGDTFFPEHDFKETKTIEKNGLKIVIYERETE